MRKWLVSLIAVTMLVLVPLAGTAEASWFPYGQCTYWAAQMRPDIGRSISGNAWYWSTAAADAGFTVNSVPGVGANAKAEISFGKDLKTNGAVCAITLAAKKRGEGGKGEN